MTQFQLFSLFELVLFFATMLCFKTLFRSLDEIKRLIESIPFKELNNEDDEEDDDEYDDF